MFESTYECNYQSIYFQNIGISLQEPVEARTAIEEGEEVEREGKFKKTYNHPTPAP
jgi:hypothetical protein